MKVLAVVLSRIADVYVANDDETMRRLFAEVEPSLVIFDHQDPADIFLLNPRRFGYRGPLLLLTADREPQTAIAILEADHWLRKPIDVMLIDTLTSRIIEIEETAGSNNH